MLWNAKVRVAVLVALATLTVAARHLGAGGQTIEEKRQLLYKAFDADNFKEAYDGLEKIARDPKNDPLKVAADLTRAMQCLCRLNRDDEVDVFRESVVAVHRGNWRLLATAAHLLATGSHEGAVIAGKFHRTPDGFHEKGRHVHAGLRDRARAIEQFDQAFKLSANEPARNEVADFYMQYAAALLSGRGWADPWRLQLLTDLTELPDYEDGYSQYYLPPHGAPVDDQGKPLLHHLPKGYDAAQTDGQRWRWLLTKAAELNPALRNEVDMTLADFMCGQLGVQTLGERGFGARDDGDANTKVGPYALHTLGDDETIAMLATGTRRFKLPDEFIWIKIYERVAGRGKSMWAERARDRLAVEYEGRRQFVKAARAWKTAIQEYGPTQKKPSDAEPWRDRKQALEQIVGNWGRFEPVGTQVAGKDARVDFRFRNGKKVSFAAYEIRVAKVLADAQAYLKSNPMTIDWGRGGIYNLGYRLVEERQQQYVDNKVATWDVELKARPGHVDDRVTVTMPLSRPGAYLVTAQMANGNLSRIIIWINDTAILEKPLERGTYYFVADSTTGKPIAQAELEFFGFKHEFLNGNRVRVQTRTFTTSTDDDGQVIIDGARVPRDFRWTIIARKDGRFAYHGSAQFWSAGRYDAEHDRTHVFIITDRPVYRPQHMVHFKAWIGHAKYEAQTSSFANKTFHVSIVNPKEEEVFARTIKADEYGGIFGELALPAGAALGSYHITVYKDENDGFNNRGFASFLVEEYKKPEFEVTIESPREPVRLGEPITATIAARYYFGAPVTRAKVKYRVLRFEHNAAWYPQDAWDWLYGRGYWWFSADHQWYPEFAEWGCPRPMPLWALWFPYAAPEVVMENEVEVGPDGTVPVVIETRAARALHGDKDHKYAISAEVTDESRRTVGGYGEVLVARKPFQVNVWVDRGFYRVGDTVRANVHAQSIDGKPVQGKGALTLFAISYDERNQPVEKAAQTWKIDTNNLGRAGQQLEASKAGQYRLSYKLTDARQHTVEGGYLFVVHGEGFTANKHRFNKIELTADRRTYKPGDKATLLVNTDQEKGTVLLFVRPANGVYQAPRIIRLDGKSTVQDVDIVQRDMPNMFVEACTISGGRVHTEIRELAVPQKKNVLNVALVPSQQQYKPGQKASVKIKLTDQAGKPCVGSTVVSVYDRSVEYISDGSNVPEIKGHFWSWRRRHFPSSSTNLAREEWNLLRQHETPMINLGLFGQTIVEDFAGPQVRRVAGSVFDDWSKFLPPPPAEEGGPPVILQPLKAARKMADSDDGPTPRIRKNFSDTALWAPLVTADANGEATVHFTMPEQTTGWKVRVWAMGHGTKVGEASAEVVTRKDLIVRLQAPRFVTEKDEVTLSANVHNFLKRDKKVTVALELDGGTLSSLAPLVQTVDIKTGGEKRVDWRVKVLREGSAIVRMKAVCDEDADAMEMRFPVFVHGMLKMESFTGVIRPNKDAGMTTFNVPALRRVNDTRLEVRYSPSLAGAMVDALPYLVDYPYGCTEQTLNRFLPTVIAQNVLLKMRLDLKEIQKTRTNLNSQEIGDDKKRIEKGWKHFDRNPVFDEQEVARMAREGITRLAAMQLADGGWGWFSGHGERAFPHTTALVVHGLQVAKASNVQLPVGMLDRGVDWLKAYQAQQLVLLKNAPSKRDPWKDHGDNLDALVYMILVDQNMLNDEMRDVLYRDRTHLSVYAKAMYGLALEKQKQADKLAMILKNIEQYLVQDDENQTAYLRLPAGNPWHCWHGDEIEANAYYLKLLARAAPKDERASRLVKYLLNNRKHATYWNSTRDTAVCIEAFAEYLQRSGEDRPDMTVEVWLDGKKHKEVTINASNLFTFDNKLVLVGDAVQTGKHTLELRRKGTGPLYWNAYLTSFTLEDFITRTGLEVKVARKYYKLIRADKRIKVPGSLGQPLGQRALRYKRIELKNLDGLKSGELVEVELEIESKNDYEYLLFEDRKPAGFEPMQVLSGYTDTGLHAYTEFRDEKVCFFVRTLARGKHSVSYRMRAETPGQFSALPARASAMYAPELQGNSDEIKLRVAD